MYSSCREASGGASEWVRGLLSCRDWRKVQVYSLWEVLVYVRSWADLGAGVQAGRSGSVCHQRRLRDGSRAARHDQRPVSWTAHLLTSQPTCSGRHTCSQVSPPVIDNTPAHKSTHPTAQLCCTTSATHPLSVCRQHRPTYFLTSCVLRLQPSREWLMCARRPLPFMGL